MPPTMYQVAIRRTWFRHFGSSQLPALPTGARSSEKSKGVKYLVGHSLGGVAAVALVEQHPELKLEARV